MVFGRFQVQQLCVCALCIGLKLFAVWFSLCCFHLQDELLKQATVNERKASCFGCHKSLGTVVNITGVRVRTRLGWYQQGHAA